MCVDRVLSFQSLTETNPNGSLQYSWRLSDGRVFIRSSDSARFAQPGSYRLELLVENEYGCRDSIQSGVQVIANCQIYVPSAFTPDLNGKNDRFRPLFYGSDRLVLFQVFDRAGQLVFETRDPQKNGMGAIVE
ncbi:MAG: PKD domain-containing protein [Bacteroidota bacterium]